MSHFSVAVFSRNGGNDVDEMLAPFDENMRVDRYVSHTKEELVEIGKKNIQDYRDSVYAEYLRDPAKYLRERCENDPENRHYRYLRDEFPQRLSWTDEEIYQCEIGGYEPDEIGDDGEIYSTYNPQSKWDWYEVGGRFSHLLQCKKEIPLKDQAYALDVDFDGMKARKEKSLIPYNEFISRNTLRKPEYLREMYPDEQTYIASMTCFSTYAVITPDGEWHAPGEMGWWGMSSDAPHERREWDLKYYERFIVPAIEHNWHITIVDCHI